VSELKRMLI